MSTEQVHTGLILVGAIFTAGAAYAGVRAGIRGLHKALAAHISADEKAHDAQAQMLLDHDRAIVAHEERLKGATPQRQIQDDTTSMLRIRTRARR